MPLEGPLKLKRLERTFSMKRLVLFIRNAITLIAILYLVIAALLFLAAFVVDSGVAGVLRNFLITGLLASPVFLLVMLLIRRWRLALALIVPVLGLILTYAPLFLPRGDFTPPADTTELTVLTFNVQTSTNSLDSLVEVIEEAGADVVALQELSREAAAYFEEELVDRYTYMALHPQENPFQGQGVLSIYPITADTYWINEELEKPLGHMRVELAVGEQMIVLYNTHPTPPFSIEWGFNTDSHSAEIEELLSRVGRETMPVVLVGDFNFSSQFAEYDRIVYDEGYSDVFREAGTIGFGFTYPDTSGMPVPIMRLDYIFHDENFHAREAHVWPRSGVSDHQPPFARLLLLNPGRS